MMFCVKKKLEGPTRDSHVARSSIPPAPLFTLGLGDDTLEHLSGCFFGRGSVPFQQDAISIMKDISKKE